MIFHLQIFSNAILGLSARESHRKYIEDSTQMKVTVQAH